MKRIDSLARKCLVFGVSFVGGCVIAAWAFGLVWVLC